MKNIKILKFLSLMLIIILMIPAVTVLADADTDTETTGEEAFCSVEDFAELLSESELNSLREYIDKIAKEYGYEIAVVTADTINGSDVVAYADDVYDYCYNPNKDNNDGILLLVVMDTREWAMSTSGKAEKAFGNSGDYPIDYVEEQFVDQLSSKEYYKAFKNYADACEKVIEYYERTGKRLKEPFQVVTWIIIGLVVGLLVALVVTGSMKSKLTSVRKQDAAQSYIRPGSLVLTKNRDYFIYRTVTRTARPKNTSSSGGSHTSSSGRSHGGSHGHF